MSATPTQEETIDGVRQKGGAACGTNSLVPPSLANPVGLPGNFLLNPMILKNNNSINTKKCEASSSSSSSSTTALLGTTKAKMPKKISADEQATTADETASNAGAWSGSVGPMTAGARRRMLILGDGDGGQEKIGGRSVAVADITTSCQEEAGIDSKGRMSLTRSPPLTTTSSVSPSVLLNNVHNPNQQKQPKSTAGKDYLAEKSSGSPHTHSHTSASSERPNARAVASSSPSPLTSSYAPSPNPTSSLDPKVSSMLLRQLQPRAVGTPSLVVRRKTQNDDTDGNEGEREIDDAMAKEEKNEQPYADSLDASATTFERSNKDNSATEDSTKVFTPNTNSGKVTPSIPLSQLPTISSQKVSNTPLGRGGKGPTAAISNAIATRAQGYNSNNNHNGFPAFISPMSPFSVSGGEGSSLSLGFTSPPPLTTPQLKKPPASGALALPPPSRQLHQHQELNNRLSTPDNLILGGDRGKADPCLALPSESFRQLSVWPATNVRKATPATAALLNAIDQKPGELTKALLMTEGKVRESNFGTADNVSHRKTAAGTVVSGGVPISPLSVHLLTENETNGDKGERRKKKNNNVKKLGSDHDEEDEEWEISLGRQDAVLERPLPATAAKTPPKLSSHDSSAVNGGFFSLPPSSRSPHGYEAGGGLIVKSPAASGGARRQGGVGGFVGQRPGAVARHEAPTTALFSAATPSRGYGGGSEEPGSLNRVPVNANVHHHPLLPDEEKGARALGTPTPTLSYSRSYSHLSGPVGTASAPRPRATLPSPGLSTTKGTTLEMLSPSPSSAALFSHFLAGGGGTDFAISKNMNQKKKPHAVEQLEQFLEDASVRLRFEYPAEESLFRDNCVQLTSTNSTVHRHSLDQHQRNSPQQSSSSGLGFRANESPPPPQPPSSSFYYSLRQQHQKPVGGAVASRGSQRRATPQKQSEYYSETDDTKTRLDFQKEGGETEDGVEHFTPSAQQQKNITPPLYAPKPVRMLVARRFDSRGAPLVGKAAAVSLLRSSSSSSSKSPRKIEEKELAGKGKENFKSDLSEEVSWEPQHASPPLRAASGGEGKERDKERNESGPRMVKSSSFRKVESEKTSASTTHISTVAVAKNAAPAASILNDHMWDYLNRRLEFHRHAAELFFTLFDAYRPVLSQILEGYESHLCFVLHHSTAEQRHWKSVSKKLESENDTLMAALKEEQEKRRESDAMCDTLRAQVEVLRHAETELKEQKMIFDHEQLMRDRQAEQAELDKATLTRRMMALEGEIAILQKQLAEPGKAIDRLNAQISAKNGHIQTLSAQNDRLASENAALKRQQAASSSSPLSSALTSHNQHLLGKDGRGDARSGDEGESDAEKLVVASRRLQEYALTNSELKGIIATQNAKIHTMKTQLNQLLEASGGIGSTIVQATAAAAAIDVQRFLGASGLSLSLGVGAASASASAGQKHANHQLGLVGTPRERAKAPQALSVLSSSAQSVHESSSEHDQASRRTSSVVRALSTSSAVGAGVKRSGSSFLQRKPSAGGSSSSATDTKNTNNTSKNNNKSHKGTSKTTSKANNSVEVPSSRAIPKSAAGVNKPSSDSNNTKKKVTAGMSMLASPLDPLSSPPSPSNATTNNAKAANTNNTKEGDHRDITQKSLLDDDDDSGSGNYKRADSQASASPPPPLGLSTAASRGHHRAQPSLLTASSSSSPFTSPRGREGHDEAGATRSSSERHPNNTKNTNPNGGSAEVEEDAYGSVRGLLLPSLNEERITAADFDQLASMYTPRPHLVSTDIARAETTAERMTLAISQIAQLKTELSAARARVSELLSLRSTKLQGAVEGMSDVFSATCATYHHPFFEDAVLAFKNPAVRWFIGAGDSEEDTPYPYLRAVGRQRNQRFSLGAVKWHIHTFFAQTPLPWRAASGASQSLGLNHHHHSHANTKSSPALGYLLQRWFDSRYPKDGPSMCYSFHATLEWFNTSDVDCYMIKAMLDGTLDETTWRRAVLAVSRLRTEMERMQALRIVAADPSARISTAMAVDELLSNGGPNADPSASFSGPSSPPSPTNRDNQGETPTSRAGETPYSFPVAGSPSRPRRRISATFINDNGLPERCLVATPKYVCSEVAVKAIGNVFGLWSNESISELVRALENASHAGVSSSAAYGGGGGFRGGQKASTRHAGAVGANPNHDKNKSNTVVGQHRKSILTPALSLEVDVVGGGGGAGSSTPTISLSSLFDAVNLSGGQMEPYFSSAVRTLWLVESYTYVTDVIECLLEKSASAAGRITPQMVVSSIVEADSECPEHAVHETAERVFAQEKPNGFVFLDDEDDEEVTTKAAEGRAGEGAFSSATTVVGVGRERDAPIHDRYLKFSDISIPLAECVVRLRKLGPTRYTPRSVYLQQRQLAHNSTAGAAVSRQNPTPSLSMPVAPSASSLTLTSARL